MYFMTQIYIYTENQISFQRHWVDVQALFLEALTQI